MPKTIVFDYPYTTLPVYPVILAAAKAKAESLGYEVLTTDDGGSLDNQVANLTTMVNKGVGAIVTFPIESSALTSVQQSAQAAGTKWITYGANMDGEDGSIDLANQASGSQIAQALGAYLSAKNITTGTVLVLGNDTVELGRQRTSGMISGLKQYAPGLTVVQDLALGSDEGASVTQAKLVSDPSIDYVLAVNDDTALGAAIAFQEAGKSLDTSFIGGNDGTPTVLGDLKTNNSFIKATIALDLTAIGQAVATTSAAAIEGSTATTYAAKPVTATPDSTNLDALIAQFN
ncbi:sugar ABC transporter substrate-binding protein [Subtercola sp. YIM 133946]|uniref:sugar ABC transporter substrate-binding protein n=1 Tax=Subtercola sp. YIM 133946 TaxID=3118909 RepID=UPI002F92F6F5